MAFGQIQGRRGWLGYARDLALVAGAQVAVAVMQFVRLPVLTRSLGPDAYGSWSLIWITIVLITPFAMLGLQAAMTRFLAAEQDHASIRDGVLSSSVVVLGAAVFFTVGLALSAGPISNYLLGKSIDIGIIQLSSTLVIAESLLGLATGYLRTFRQMRFYSAGIVIRQALELGLMVAFLRAGFDLTGLVIAVLVSDLILVLAVYALIVRQNGLSYPRYAHLGEWLRYGIYTVPSSAILWIIHSSDRYLLAWSLTDRDVGIYAASYTLANVVSMALSPVQAVLFPTLSQSFDQRDFTATKNYLAYTLKLLALISFPIAFGLWALAPGLLPLLTTSDYGMGAPAVAYISFGLIFYSLFQVSLYVLYLYKKTYLETILLSSAAVLNVVLNLILIPLMGIEGSALSTLIAFLVLAGVTTYITRRNLEFPLNPVFIMKSISASALMWLALNAWKPDDWWSVILAIAMGAILYFGLMLAFRAFKREELSSVVNLVRGHRRPL
jgi:O-antigen/teichoic acid export membrane protein